METQGQPGTVEPAQPNAGGQPQPEPAVDPSQKYVAEPQPAAQPSAEQGQVQGQVQQQTGGEHFQSLYNREYAAKLAIQQELDRERAEKRELFGRLAPQQTVQQNPYNPETNNADYWRWEMQASADRAASKAAQEATRATQEQFQSLIQQASEAQWVQSHPGVDVQGIKAFNRANGIAEWNLDAGLRLLNYPQASAQAAQTSAQNVLNLNRQPTVGAVPLRGQTAGGGEVALSYEKMAEDYQNTNGEAAKSWSPELQAAFKQETYRRSAASRRAS